jgi:DNA-binding NarL/FixJ family response regulator
MSKIKIMLVDDHQIVRDGIKALLSTEDSIQIIDEASDGDELLSKLRNKKPDILIMDISMPKMSGIELLKIVSKEYPDIKVLILSMYTNEDFVFNAVKSGAMGYLPKNTSRKILIEAIQTIYAGEEYFSKEISNIILKSYIKKAQKYDDSSDRKREMLSIRELEILKLVAEGKSNQEIAEKLFISIRTVESHKNHIMQKMELKSTVDLIKYALKNNLADN